METLLLNDNAGIFSLGEKKKGYVIRNIYIVGVLVLTFIL